MDLDDFLELIDLDKQSLNYWLYEVEDDTKYKIFKIKKKRGKKFRIITAPCEDLLSIQHRILNFLENYIFANSLYNPSSCVTGFIKGKSIISNAFIHKNQNIIINIDLKDFFPSITFTRICKLLSSPPYNFNESIASVIAQSTCYNKYLAQGSPLSPLISNLICHSLDIKLLCFAKENRLKYSRYADDITFSTNRMECSALYIDNGDGSVSISNYFSSLIKNSGFKINIGKFKVLKKSTRQMVTGLVVNRKVNVDRRYIREIRSILHNAEKDLHTACEIYFLINGYKYKDSRLSYIKKLDLFKKIIRGKIEFVRRIRGYKDVISIKLYKQYLKVFFPELKSLYYPREALCADDILYNSTLIIANQNSIHNTGCGYLIKGNYLVTSYHTYENIYSKSNQNIVAFHRDDTQKFDLKFIGADKHFNVAIFKIIYKSYKIYSYLDIYNGDVKIGDKIYSSGYYNGHEIENKLFIRKDTVNEIYFDSNIRNVIYSGHIAKGMSGCPVTILCENNTMQDKEYQVIGHIVKQVTGAIKYIDEFELGVVYAYDIRDKIKEILDI